MEYDLKIINGMVYAGDGGDPVRADIAVKDGTIVAVGEAAGAAGRVIDATGMIVTPGFIDPHTHYDAQALWDNGLETSVRHGVTTAVAGNCGVGFAPFKPRDKQNLISLMAGVEDIPSSVLEEGLAWDWETFGDYIDRLDGVERAIDLAVQVPHDCVRLYVMGERAARGEKATPDDIARMAEVVRDSLLAGAVGFSFGRVAGHRSDDGRLTPSYDADHDELVAIAAAMRDLPYRVLQGVTDGRVADGPEAFDDEYRFVHRMVEAAGRPVSLNLHRRAQPVFSREAWRKVLAQADGPDRDLIRFQVNAKAGGYICGLTSTVNLLAPFPTYRAVAHLPLAERVAALRDPAARARLLAESPTQEPGDASRTPWIIGVLEKLDELAARIFIMPREMNVEPQYENSIAAYAEKNGIGSLEAIYDLSLADDGAMLFDYPMMNYVEGNLDNLHVMLTHPNSFFGVADAGAHLGCICDFSATTVALTHWARDRSFGPTIPLPEVVHMLTGKIADHLGFRDRGRLEPGLRADINVIDHDNLRLFRPYHAADLPAGGERYLQHAAGYRAVLVAGIAVLEDDVPTGARPGRALRAAAA